MSGQEGPAARHAAPDQPAAKLVSVVIPVFNQVDYTRGCLESLRPDLAGGLEVIIVDNGSRDGTDQYLATWPGIKVIHNPANRGCATAWNQGVGVASREWIVILNNDVVVAPGWLEALVQFARNNDAAIVTPAIREGPLNYSFLDYAEKFVARMEPVCRWGVANGICFMVHRPAFEQIGVFDEKFRIGQFEDSDFFLRAKKAGFRLGTTGGAFLHHFGSITQDAIRGKTESQPVNSYEAENRAYFRQKWGLTPMKRYPQRWHSKVEELWWRTTERCRHGHSLHEKWVNGKLIYC